MTNQVTITANQDGLVVNKSLNNEEFGYIRVESNTPVIQGGFLRDNNRSALIMGNFDTLINYVEKHGLVNGSKLDGKIVVIETTVQPYDGAQPKRAGAEGDVLKKNGSPIYRTTKFTTSLEEQDSLIQHDAIASNPFIGAQQPNLKAATA